MGDKYLGIGRSRIYFSCENQAKVGQVLVIDTNGNLVTAFLRQENIADGAIQGRHMAPLDEPLFGFPADGDFVADGAAAMPGATLAAMKYTLTRDVNFGLLRINTGVTIATSGYRVFASRLTLVGSAIIHNDGGAGVDGGPARIAGPGGAAAAAGSISYSTDAGRAGGEGGGISSVGNPAAAGARSIYPGIGGACGKGGDGQDSQANGGSGGSTATLSPPKSSVLAYPKILELVDGVTLRGVSGGTGGSGGGGGGGGTAGAGGGGGGGGGAGGVCLVVAGVLDTNAGAWTGRVSANGGNGGSGIAGAGGAPPSGGGIGGAGGGGGGGAAILIARQIIGNLSTSTALDQNPPACLQARGGSKGAVGSQDNLVEASPGRAILINLSQPFVHPGPSERPTSFDARPVFARGAASRGQRHYLAIKEQSIAPTLLGGPPPILAARPCFLRGRRSGISDVLKP